MKIVYKACIVAVVFLFLMSVPLFANDSVTDYPDFWLEAPTSVNTGETFEVKVMISGDSKIAAADFSVSYDPSVFRCSKPTVPSDVSAKGSMVMANKNYADGLVKFSFINQDGLNIDQHVLSFEMTVIKSIESSILITSGSGVVDENFKNVLLDYIPLTLNIEIEEFDVTFLDYDKKELSVQKVMYMESAKEPQVPQRSYSDELHYVFVGWDGSFEDITEDIILTAQYREEKHQWDKGCIITKPEINKEGEIMYTCNVCKKERKESIPALTIDITFDDVSDDDWFAPYVYDLVSLGIIHGKGVRENGNAYFDPQGLITRAEFAKILAVASGESLEGYDVKCIFNDTNDHWASAYINWAYEKGIVAGFPDGTFRAEDYITREQMAVMLYRFADHLHIDLPYLNDRIAFADKELITWSAESVYAMQQAGIISGYKEDGVTVFKPQGNAKRSEAAKMVSAFLDL